MLMYGMIYFIFGLMALSFNRDHILSLLLSLEFISLSLFLILILLIGSFFYEVLIYFFIVVVCEASLGLSSLIIMISFYGVDYFKSFNFLSC